MQAQQRLLGDVLGLLAVAEHAQREPEDRPLVAPHQRLEGAGVARLPAAHELGVGIDRSRCVTSLAARHRRGGGS